MKEKKTWSPSTQMEVFGHLSRFIHNCLIDEDCCPIEHVITINVVAFKKLYSGNFHFQAFDFLLLSPWRRQLGFFQLPYNVNLRWQRERNFGTAWKAVFWLSSTRAFGLKEDVTEVNFVGHSFLCSCFIGDFDLDKKQLKRLFGKGHEDTSLC